MENISLWLLPVLLAAGLLQKPAGLLLKLAVRAGRGFALLWLLNLAAPATGFTVPVTPVTVLAAGLLGLPGIALAALLRGLQP